MQEPTREPKPDKPPGRREKKKAEARRRLLEEGLRLMGQRGVNACKVEEITRAAGVGKGTFFTHFATKQEFVGVLAAMVLDDLARRVRPLGMAPSDAESLAAGVGAVHLRFFQLRPEAAAVLAEACGPDGEGMQSPQAVGRMGEHLDMVAGMLAPAAEGLGWPPERARELALMVVATSLGYFWFGRGQGLGGDTPAGLLDRLGRALARGLAAPGGGRGPAGG